MKKTTSKNKPIQNNNINGKATSQVSPNSRSNSSSSGTSTRKKKKVSRKTIRKIRARRRAAGFALATILMAVSLVFSFKLLFIVKSVEVIGTQKYTIEEIAEFCAIPLESNIFLVKTKELEQKLMEKFVYIETVEVNRVLPNKITVEINDALPTYYVSLSKNPIETKQEESGGEGAQSQTGQDTGNPSAEDVPEISEQVDGEVYQIYSQGFKKISQQSTRPENLIGIEADITNETIFEILNKILTIIQSSQINQITQVKILSENSISVVYKNQLEILLGNQLDIDYKAKIAYKVLINEIGEDAKGILDCSESGSAIYKPSSILVN